MIFKLQTERFPPPDGKLIYAPVPWDSLLFGFPFYELKCHETGLASLEERLPDWLKWIGKDGRAFASCSIAPDQVDFARVIARNGFYPVETLIEIHLPLARFKPVVGGRFAYLTMSPAQAEDLPALAAIAGSAFSADRFHLDRRLPADKADLRYARWIENGFKSGDHVLVLRDARVGRPAGFVLAREDKPGVFDMSLAALAPEHHRSGAGLVLYQETLVQSAGLGCRLAVAWISINNLTSLKAAERLGFVARSAVTKFHWISDTQCK